MVNYWINFIQELFPQSCLLCAKEGKSSICEDCLPSLPYNSDPCPRCGIPLKSEGDDFVCGSCLSNPPSFDKTIAPLLYRPPIDQLLNQLKHQRKLENAKLLSQLFLNSLATRSVRVDALVPIPMHAKRYRQRGFNQSLEIARHISHRLKIPIALNLLEAAKHHSHQQGASKKDRRHNIKGAFQAKDCTDKKISRIALIDDVITTGATADEAAKTLKQAGIEYVEVWAIARTPSPGNPE